MTDFESAVVYIVIVAIFGFVLGRILPNDWFDPTSFPFRSFVIEKNGKIYNALKIRKWINIVPDLSKIFIKIMPAKKIDNDFSSEHILLLIRESCMAEFIHVLSCFLGIPIMLIYKKVGGFVLYLLFIMIGNIPYILIQRYIRPRLMRLYRSIEKKSSEKISEYV